jgi:uncharacterized membrane protein
MEVEMLAWLVAIPLLGLATGLRSMTPIAILCWVAYRGDLSLVDTWGGWSGHLVTVVIFGLLAVGELIVDKLPWTPDRTSAGPLAVRLLAGGLVGALAATGLDGSVVEGILLGVIGVLLGAFGGHYVRRELVQRVGWEDWHVALVEDFIAVVGSILALGFVTAQG